MTANSMTSVGRNMKVKRNKLSPKAAFCPGKRRRAMSSSVVDESIGLVGDRDEI